MNSPVPRQAEAIGHKAGPLKSHSDSNLTLDLGIHCRFIKSRRNTTEEVEIARRSRQLVRVLDQQLDCLEMRLPAFRVIATAVFSKRPWSYGAEPAQKSNRIRVSQKIQETKKEANRPSVLR